MSPPLDQLLQQASDHHECGRLTEARILYEQILRTDRNHALTLHQLGVLEAQSSNLPAALALVRRATELAPDVPLFACNLAMLLETQGILTEALPLYRRAVELQPESADFQFKLGNALRLSGDLTAAQACYRQALRIEPRHTGALNNLGNCLRILHQHDQALECFQTLVQLSPADFRSWINLGGTLGKLDRFGEAVECYRRVLLLQGDDPALLRAKTDAQSCLIHARLFDPGASHQDIACELAEWNRRGKHPPHLAIPPRSTDPARRLRIGYVSADFGNHVAGQNLIPLFRHHNHREFEVFCYANSNHADPLRDEFQKLADHFHLITGEDDQQTAARIVNDQIDILVDLSVHTAGNRLGVFARKPAPVQATFAGYPGSTGLDAVDYRITDSHLEPEDQPIAEFPEKPLRLASFWCFDSLGDEPPINALPARSNGYVTFGCLNSFAKVNESMLHLWAGLLQSMPDARLMLLAAPGLPRRQTLDFMERAGVSPGRISFHARCPRPEYLRLFNQMDLALDTLPYNGHTTSLDSLFMGVPVVSLVGKTSVGRAGLSQLTNLKLPDWIARTAGEYSQIARHFAQDLSYLEHLRATLRERMRGSPLMDGPRFARDMEALYREMWQNHSAKRP
jgi:predicted O-linked N-acetylglucosamine transferase (SPINDLY family)